MDMIGSKHIVLNDLKSVCDVCDCILEGDIKVLEVDCSSLGPEMLVEATLLAAVLGLGHEQCVCLSYIAPSQGEAAKFWEETKLVAHFEGTPDQIDRDSPQLISDHLPITRVTADEVEG